MMKYSSDGSPGSPARPARRAASAGPAGRGGVRPHPSSLTGDKWQRIEKSCGNQNCNITTLFARGDYALRHTHCMRKIRSVPSKACLRKQNKIQKQKKINYYHICCC